MDENQITLYDPHYGYVKVNRNEKIVINGNDMSKWPGLFTCGCGSQQACHEDSICNAKKMCVECIARDSFVHTKNRKLEWESNIASVLVYYLTTGVIERGI